MRRFLFFICLLFAFPAWSQTQVTDSVTLDFRSLKDNIVQQQNPSFNYGGYTTSLICGWEAANQRWASLLYFDLSSIPSDAIIDTAILTVTEYSHTGGATNDTLHVSSILHNWVVGTSTGAHVDGASSYDSTGQGTGVNGDAIVSGTKWTSTSFLGGVCDSVHAGWDVAYAAGSCAINVSSSVRTQLAETTFGFCLWVQRTRVDGTLRYSRTMHYYATNWNASPSLFIRYKTNSRRNLHNFQANSDLVKVCPAITRLASATSVNVATAAGYSEYLNMGNSFRIRQNGTIEKVRFFCSSVTDLDTFVVRVWRRRPRLAGEAVPTQWDLVGSSENISASLAADSNTVTLSSPITGVHEGDYVGWRIASTAGGNFLKADTIKYHPFYTIVAATDTTNRLAYINSPTVPTSAVYAWQSQTFMYKVGVAIECYMQAPQVVCIGNSITSGANGHHAFLLPSTALYGIDSTYPKIFGDSTEFTYQNMGIFGDLTNDYTAWGGNIGGAVDRFTSDVIDLHSKVVVFMIAVNNIVSDVSPASTIADFQTMFSAMQNSGSIEKVYWVKILPWMDATGTNARLARRDSIHTVITSLLPSYPKIIAVNADTLVGIERAGGDANNYWDMQTALKNADNLHWMYAGNKKIAQAIIYAIYNTDFTTGLSSGNWQGGFQKAWRGGWSGGWR